MDLDAVETAELRQMLMKKLVSIPKEKAEKQETESCRSR